MSEEEKKVGGEKKTEGDKVADMLAKKIKETVQTTPADADKPLTAEDIRKLPGDTRAQLAVDEINGILKKFHCVYDPIFHLTNSGYHIEVKVIGLAFSGPGAPYIPPPGDPRWV